MTIPLDNLYHFIEGLFFEPICMYLFYPHGSRNISDVRQLQNIFASNVIYPIVVCHDQEPLNYKLYQTHSQEDIDRAHQHFKQQVDKNTLAQSNLSLAVNAWCNLYDKMILLHSEKNSQDLAWYESQRYIGVYYWCHAIIARDWYRFAKFDQRLNHSDHKKDFLIYCRDWSGSREYRVKFQELLHQNNLRNQSVTSIKHRNSQDQDIKNFIFDNPNLTPASTDFFDNLNDNLSVSSSSADYCVDDYNSTRISVVLETVFDGKKIHLTEKILRPIACGHPFILAAGPGGLEYLKSYGFKTFSPWINEDYDLEYDSVKRLEKIVSSMKRFSDLCVDDKNKIYDQLKQVAEYNQQRFFSSEFVDQVKNELVSNAQTALSQVKKTRSTVFRSRIKNSDAAINSSVRLLAALLLRQLKNTNRS